MMDLTVTVVVFIMDLSGNSLSLTNLHLSFTHCELVSSHSVDKQEPHAFREYTCEKLITM